jgi:sulfate permease, SulP family
VLVIDCSGVGAVDATGVHMLDGLQADLAAAGVDLRLATLRGPVRDVLGRAGLWGDLGERCHTDVEQALLAAGQEPDGPLLRPADGEQAPPALP